MRTVESALSQHANIIEGLDRARSGPVRVLSDLTQRTPERLWLTALETKGASITIPPS